MQKHAYLFIVFNNFRVLEKSLRLIDDERNDIFIHLDKKSNSQEQLEKITSKLKKSKVYFTERIDVRWGDYTQVECELLILKKAIQIGEYKYYHLLSESDMPIKTQEEIHEFFKENEGTEFIEVQKFPQNKLFETRFKCYHIFTKSMRNKNKIIRYSTYFFRKSFVILQYIFKYDRTKKYQMDIKYGSNWFSITDNMARYILENEKLICQMFKHGSCVDEHFLQTMAYNSDFRNKLSKEGNMRFIIWKKNSNSPYVFKDSDYGKIINSNKLFARKFQEKEDFNIVEKIFNSLNNKE